MSETGCRDEVSGFEFKVLDLEFEVCCFCKPNYKRKISGNKQWRCHQWMVSVYQDTLTFLCFSLVFSISLTSLTLLRTLIVMIFYDA